MSHLKIAFCFSLLILLFSCTSNREKEDIVTVTIVPQKYFAEKIAGDKFKINTMVPSGSSPETYEPSASSMIALDKSKGYFRIGNIGFEKNWIQKLKENHPNLPVFDNSKGIRILGGEVYELNVEDDDNCEDIDSQCSHSHHSHACHADGDPHIWTSTNNGLIIAKNILDAFVEIDPENKDFYTANYTELVNEINHTRDSISEILKNSKDATFVIYHPSLTYFADEYNLHQFAIENEGKEPSAATLKKLIDDVRKSNAKVVFIQQEFDKKNAQIIANELGLKVVQINPLSDDWNNELINVAKAIAQ